MISAESRPSAEPGQGPKVQSRVHERYGVAREVTTIDAYETFRRTIAQESGIIMNLNEAFIAHNSVRSGAPIPRRESR